MKNILAALSGHKSNKVVLVGSAFMLTMLGAPQSYAEDIEIYESLTGDVATSTPQEFRPNILFLLDTSGSMDQAEVVPLTDSAARPDFNPNIDYGPSNNDDIYVYDNARVYTGNYVEGSDNNCRAATQFHQDNPTFPEYFDKALLWNQEIATTTTTTQNCSNFALIQQLPEGTFNASSGNAIRTVGPGIDTFVLNLRAGSTYRVTMDVEREGGNNNNFAAEFNLEFYDGGRGNRITFASDCDNVDFSRNQDGSCQFTIPDNSQIDRALIRLRAFHNGNASAVAFVEESRCQDVISTVQGPVDADWVVAIDVPNGDDEIAGIALECEVDNGVHGRTNNSSERYPQSQEATNTSFAPNYTAVSNNRNVIVWDSDQFPERYLYPGNYHDYLQASFEDLVKVTFARVDDVAIYCNQRIADRDLGEFVTEDGINNFFCQTRLAAMKEATNNILSSLTGARVGMARFNNRVGGSIITKIDDIGANSGAHRDTLIQRLNALPASGGTPLHESLNEARLYYAGGEAKISTLASLKSITDDPNSTVDVPTAFEANSNEINTDPEALVGTPNLNSSNLTALNNALNNAADDSVRRRILRSNTESFTYESPILSECQDNSIIFLSDGAASVDRGNQADIEAFSQQSCTVNTSTSGSFFEFDQVSEGGDGSRFSTVDGGCLVPLATGLANRDVDGDTSNGTNRVYTYTVAFGSAVSSGTNSAQLLETSNAGLRPGNSNGDQHFTASTSTALTTAFQTILRDLVRVEADTFVAPAVSVNAFNRLQFNNEVYFAVFEPNDRARWTGNIKGYTIDSQANILDQDGNPAVDETTGQFLDSARSFWSDQDDGSEVTRGGFTEQLDLNPVRRLFANIIDTNAAGGANPVVELTESNFLATIDDVAISSVSSLGALTFGGADAQQQLQDNRDNIVAWTFGQDVDGDLGGAATDPNFFIGESLHSSPYVLDFGTVNTTDDDIDFDSENIVFSLTNQGMVHAIDADNGNELWAYIPDASLFSNLGDYYNNVAGSDHTYGLDGEIAFDVARDPTTLELTRAQIFVGQRRGGSKYFAMDLLNANFNNPNSEPVSKLWTLSNLPRMGQSWATPVATTLNFCDDGNDKSSCDETEVLVISGGYNTAYDSEDVPLTSLAGNVDGNAIYIVDRATGELLWVAGRPGQVEPGVGENYAYYTNDDMTHSFPTEPTVIDSDNDGVTDLMFAVDIAGRVWRFDFSGHAIGGAQGAVTRDTNDIVRNVNNNPDGNDLSGNTAEVSAGIIADLSEPGANRRFYNRPDVSLTARTENDLARYNIVVGSGYRAHPRFSEVAQNRVYFIFDRNVSAPQLVADSNGDFERITYDYVQSGTGLDNNINIDELDSLTTDLDTLSANRNGFFIPLPNTDEKLLNPTLTNAGVVLAVTYAPSPDVTANEVVCQRTTGVSFLHRIDLSTGAFTTIELDADGISARPIVIEVPDDEGNLVKILVVGTETFETGETDTDGDGEPSVPLAASQTGQIRRLNWWERSRSLVQ